MTKYRKDLIPTYLRAESWLDPSKCAFWMRDELIEPVKAIRHHRSENRSHTEKAIEYYNGFAQKINQANRKQK